MIRRQPRTTRTDTTFPSKTLFRSIANAQAFETGKFILCRPARVAYETTALVNRLSSSRPPGPTAGGTSRRDAMPAGPIRSFVRHRSLIWQFARRDVIEIGRAHV